MKVAALILVAFAALAGAEIVSHVDTPHVTYDTHHADHPTPAVAYTKPAYKEDYSYGPAYYKYDYAVKDDYYNDYGHQESREGDSTKGSYWVALPDGRRMVVTYYVDGNSGFVADVKYENEYHKPEYKPYRAYHAEPSVYHHEPKVDYHHPEPKADYHHVEHKYHPEPHHHSYNPEYVHVVEH